MLRAIHEREGIWGDVGAEAEIVDIGQSVGLVSEK